MDTKKPDIGKANEAKAKKYDALSQIVPVMEVRDLEHARSDEVITFAVKYLCEGGTFEELRRKLGLGPSHKDNRWREIRGIISQGLLPKSEDEALLLTSGHRHYYIGKLEQALEDVEERIKKGLPERTEFQYLKIRNDCLKLLLEANQAEFDSFAEISKIRSGIKGARGTINVINNFPVPRPGQDRDMVRDVVATFARIADADPEKLPDNGQGGDPS